MARKPKEPKQPKPKKEKPEKPPKMRSSAPRRFGAWVLVIFMLFTIGFGVFKIWNAPTEIGITAAVEKQKEAFTKDTWSRTKAVAFAERFAIAYFTNQAEEDYVSKMSAFYATGALYNSPDVESEVRYVGTTDVQIDEDGYVNVDVACQVAYARNNSGVIDLIQFATIRVPIHIDENGNCSVVATPIYVAESNNPRGSKTVMSTIPGDGDLADKENIEATIQNFFAVYFGGTSSELKYYITKNYGEPATVGLGMEVDSVESQIKKESDYWVAECTVLLKNAGIAQEQHCFLQIVKGAEGRYYINELSVH